MTTTVPRLYPCPNCKKSIKYDVANPYRPFCCERCKTGDIAAWADENYRMAGEPADVSGQDSSELDE